jgi:hypothetical protein
MKNSATYKTKWAKHSDREFSSLSDARRGAKNMIKEYGIHPNDFKGIERGYYNAKGKWVEKHFSL